MECSFTLKYYSFYMHVCVLATLVEEAKETLAENGYSAVPEVKPTVFRVDPETHSQPRPAPVEHSCTNSYP